MKFTYKDHWEKLNKKTLTYTYDPISREEYEKIVLPLAQDRIDNPMDAENFEMLEGAVDCNATAMDFFRASPEEIEQLKKRILADYRAQCIFDAEQESGYRYWQEAILEEN